MVGDNFTSGEVKSRRHHTDNDVRLAVEQHAVANHAAVSSEAALSKAITQHYRSCSIGCVFFGADCPPKQGRNPKYSKHRRVDCRAFDWLGLANIGQIDRQTSKGNHRREAVSVAFQSRKLGGETSLCD